MNVYDFDGTIYDGDSSIDFYFYCLRHHPEILKALPKQFMGAVLFISGKISKTQFKEKYFSFVKYLTDIDSDVKNFWSSHQKKIKTWYLQKHLSDDVIITASPEFLIAPICRIEKIQYVIASSVDKRTGSFSRENCRGKEKVLRFREQFPDSVINEFYSDSLSDNPLADIANNPYLIEGENIKKWNS